MILLSTTLKDFPFLFTTVIDKKPAISFTNTNIPIAPLSQSKFSNSSKQGGDTHIFYNIISFSSVWPSHNRKGGGDNHIQRGGDNNIK